jgi:cyclophilin family peptidyl-prolyl cis-trans isomerase
VPTEKRARQRAAREQKQAVIQKSRKRRRNTRRVIGLVIAAAAIVGIVFLVNGGSKSATPPTTTTTTRATTTTTPTVAAATPTCPPAAGSAKQVLLFKSAPPSCIPANSVWDVTLKTSAGDIVERMSAASSFAAVNNFIFLARYKYFDDTLFFRVLKGFVVQGGSPTDTDSAGATGKPGPLENGYPGYSFTGNTPPSSCTKNPAQAACYQPGEIAMANSGAPSSDSGEFFLILPGGQKILNGEPNYTIFGYLTSGMSVLEKIGAGGAPISSSTGAPTIKYYLLGVTVTQVAS